MAASPESALAPRQSGRRQFADVIIAGWSLTGALTGALLCRAGWKVLWLGSVPHSGVSVGNDTVPAAPGVTPSLGHSPALARVLDELGLLNDVQHQMQPVPWQILGDRRRITLPDDAVRLPGTAEGFQTVARTATTADEFFAADLKLGFFALRAFRKKQAAFLAGLPAATGIVGELASSLDSLLGSGPDNRASIAQTLASTHDLPGGLLTLQALLARQAMAAGGRVLNGALSQPLIGGSIGWTRVDLTLGSGEQVGARVLLLAMDSDAIKRWLPAEDQGLLAQTPMPGAQPLLRLSYVVKTRGLPEALGPVAILEGTSPILVERRPIAAGRESVSLFWRSDGSDIAAQSQRVAAAFGEVAPFHERHVIAQLAAEEVPGHARLDAVPPQKLARRMPVVYGPVLNLGGLDGAALLAPPLALRAMRLAPRRDLLK